MDILKYVCNENLFDNIKMIITDENMEFLNGSEAIKVLRIIEERKKCNKKFIISLTCHENNEIIDNINICGADVVISKPISVDKIIKYIDLIK